MSMFQLSNKAEFKVDKACFADLFVVLRAGDLFFSFNAINVCGDGVPSSFAKVTEEVLANRGSGGSLKPAPSVASVASSKGGREASLKGGS